MTWNHEIAAKTALLVLAGFAHSPAPAQEAGLGGTSATAIEVCRPAGQREYLSRLVCPSGQAPGFQRTGSFGPRTEPPRDMTVEQGREQSMKMLRYVPLAPGEPDYHIVDGYLVVCPDRMRTIFMDMYHCDKPPPSEAPPGFTLRPN